MDIRTTHAPGGTHTRRRDHGFTLIEAAVSMSVFAVLLATVVSTFLNMQRGVDENLSLDQVRQKTHFAAQRLSDLVSQATTVDPEFQLLGPDVTSGFHGLEFRLVSSLAGGVSYDDAARVYVLGPESAAYPADGLVIGRGPNLAAVSASAGPDLRLGTNDDDFAQQLATGEAVVELLLSSRFAPQAPPMFRIDIVDRVVEITVRTNFQQRDGSFLLPNDFELRERIALRQ